MIKLIVENIDIKDARNMSQNQLMKLSFEDLAQLADEVNLAYSRDFIEKEMNDAYDLYDKYGRESHNDYANDLQSLLSHNTNVQWFGDVDFFEEYGFANTSRNFNTPYFPLKNHDGLVYALQQLFHMDRNR